MNKITLSVNDENVETVLTVLNNLKAGLINEIVTNGESIKRSPTQHQPKSNTIIREEDSGTNDTSGKYSNAAAYKRRLKRK